MSSLGAWHQLRLVGALPLPKPFLSGSRRVGQGLGAAAHIFPVTSFILLPLIPCLSQWERSHSRSWSQGKGQSLSHLQRAPALLTHLSHLDLWAEHIQGQPSRHQPCREWLALRNPDMEIKGQVLDHAEN